MNAMAHSRAQQSGEEARIPASPYTPKDRAQIRAELYAIESCLDELALRLIADELGRHRSSPAQASPRSKRAKGGDLT